MQRKGSTNTLFQNLGPKVKQSWLLFTQADAPDPIGFFNDDLNEISEGVVCESESELNNMLYTSKLHGAPIVVKVNLDKQSIEGLIEDGQVDKIAEKVTTIDSNRVSFDGKRFQTMVEKTMKK